MTDPTKGISVEEAMERLSRVIGVAYYERKRRKAKTAAVEMGLDDTALAVLRERLGENHLLRELLWYRHGCDVASLYGDDGEHQCGTCIIDFKRDSADAISARFRQIGEAKYKKALDEGWHWTDDGRFLPPDKKESDMDAKRIEELKLLRENVEHANAEGGLSEWATRQILALIEKAEPQAEERKEGHKALRWNKEKQDYETFDPNPTLPVAGEEGK